MLGLRRRGSSAHGRLWGELTSALLDGELSAPDSDRLREHAAGCALCQQRLSDYRLLDGRLQRLTGAVATPPAYAIFERVGTSHALPLGVRVPGRLAMAASAAVLVVGGAASPQVRDGIGNAVQYVRQIAAPAASVSYAGDRAIFKAPRNSVIVRSVRGYGLFLAAADSTTPRPFSASPVPRGPVYALAGGAVLMQGTGGAGWLTVGSDGATRMFPIPPGMQVVDVTPAGDRLLLRTPDGQGGFSTAAGATQVVDASGSVVWSDPGGADVYSLSPDGRFALSGEPNALVKIPLDAGGPLPGLNRIPFNGQNVQRPQLSRDGTRAVFLSRSLAGGSGVTLTYAVLGSGFGVPPYRQSMTAADPPVFALSPDGRYLAVQAVESGGARKLDVWTLDISSGTPDTLPAFTGATIQRLAWSADGTRLLIVLDRGGSGEAWLWSEHGGLARLMTGTDAGSAAWLPDGSGVVVTSDQGNPPGLVALGPPNKGQQNDPIVPLLGTDASLASPLFAGHGDHVALVASGANVSVPEILARKGLPPASITGTAGSWSWSPDGHRAVFTRDGSAYLWSDRTGADASPLASATAAVWSQSGDRILVEDQTGAIRIVDARGATVATAPEPLRGATLSWAPDGRSLAGVVHTTAAGDTLVRWDAGSSDVRTLLQGGRMGAPAWSPDGRSLAIFRAAASDAPADLLLLPATGGEARKLATALSPTAALIWQPDGSRLVFIDQPAPGAPGHLHAVAPDGSGGRTATTLYATELLPGPH